MTSECAARASARIREHLAVWPVLQQAQTIAAYMAFGNEVNLAPLMDQFRGKRWAISRTLKPEPHLIFHLYEPACLVRHRFGMLEPEPGLPVVEPREFDLILVPGIVFDRRGYRLGFGAGFYDRFLPHTAAIKVGAVYADLIVEHAPNDAFDQRVDYIACEAGISAAVV